MTNLNKFGITEAQMLTIAGKHDVSYTFGKGSMARILAYSQELLSLAAPAVANAAPPAPVVAKAPKGWKLVPEDPTGNMYRAAAKIDNEMFAGGSSHGAEDGQIWNAMYDAAPSYPDAAEPDAALMEALELGLESASDLLSDAPRSRIMEISGRIDKIRAALAAHAGQGAKA